MIPSRVKNQSSSARAALVVGVYLGVNTTGQNPKGTQHRGNGSPPAQATAAKRLIEDAGSHYVALAAVVGATDNAVVGATDNKVRRDLNIRSLISLHGPG